MQIPSTPASSSSAAPSRTSASRSGSTSAPITSIRPRTPFMRSRGTIGSL